MKRKLFKSSIFITILLVMLEGYRWYSWEMNYENWTVWTFLTNKGHTGLLWNLLLGWIAVLFGWLVLKSQNRIWAKFLSLVWILWLPNTLYMLTDLKYFGADKTTSLIQEVVFFSLFGIAGIILYGLSVYLVWLRYKFNKKWLAIITSLAIIGVAAGRLLRWNSWEVFTNPQKLLSDFINLF